MGMETLHGALLLGLDFVALDTAPWTEVSLVGLLGQIQPLGTRVVLSNLQGLENLGSRNYG